MMRPPQTVAMYRELNELSASDRQAIEAMMLKTGVIADRFDRAHIERGHNKLFGTLDESFIRQEDDRKSERPQPYCNEMALIDL